MASSATSFMSLQHFLPLPASSAIRAPRIATHAIQAVYPLRLEFVHRWRRCSLSFRSSKGENRRLVVCAEANERGLGVGSSEVVLEPKPDASALLQKLSRTFRRADPELLATLPNDLKVDLSDAAFAINNADPSYEVGEAAGNVLVQLGQSLEKFDMQGAADSLSALAEIIPSLPHAGRERAYIGRRIGAAGKRFGGMGSYGNGVIQTISKEMQAASEKLLEGFKGKEKGDLLPRQKFKFGPVDVEVTAGGAFTGAAVAAVFGLLSWQAASVLQAADVAENISNDRAALVTQSLHGVLLAFSFSSAFLSALLTFGLIGLGIKLSSQGETK